MKSIVCQVVKSEFGIGIVPNKLMPWYYETENFLTSAEIGHDIIDHFLDGQLGKIEQEFAAYGSIIFNTQGLKCWIDSRGSYRRYENYNSIVSDFTNFFRDAFSRIEDIMFEECMEKVSKKSINYIDGLLRPALLDNDDFYTYIIKDFIYDDDDFDEDILISTIKKEWDNIVKWVAYGYNKAKKRYRNYDPFEVVMIKHRINKAGEKLRLREEYIGETISLRYDIHSEYACYYYKGEKISEAW